MNSDFPLNYLPGVSILWAVVAGILAVIVQVSFALAVLADSQQLSSRLHRRTFFVGGGMWTLATLLGGVFVAAIYWLIHHSTLRPQHLAAEPVPPPNPEP